MTKIKKRNILIPTLCIIAGMISGAITYEQYEPRIIDEDVTYHEFPPITDSTLQDAQHDSYHHLLTIPSLPNRAQGMIVYDAETAVNISKHVLSSLLDTPHDVRNTRYEVRKVNGYLWQIDVSETSTNEVYHILLSGHTGEILELTLK